MAIRLHQTTNRITTLIMRLLKPRFHEINHPDPRLASALMLETLRAALNQRSQSFLPGARPAKPKQSDEAFIREMKRMAAAYLQVDPA